MLQQGRYEDALKLLKSGPLPSDQPDLIIPILALEAEANVETHNFSEAEGLLNRAAAICATSASGSCGYVFKARGLLEAELNQWASAERQYELCLAFARSHADAVLESHALLNLGNAALAQGRFDEAIDRSEAGYQTAQAAGARRLELIIQGNLGWAYYRLGDSEKALELFTKSEKLASQLGDAWNQENQLTNIGYIYMDQRRLDVAERSFQQASNIAHGINAKEDVYNALRALARLALQTGDLVNATKYAQRAVESARQDGNHLDELYPMLVQGQIAARRGGTSEAEMMFQQVERDKLCPVFLKWEAEHSLARLYEDEKRSAAADREYRVALATFESARDEVWHEDSQLSFLTNASHIYDDYVHFLVAQGKTDDALRWADYSRARTLAEGLGLLTKGTKGAPSGPPQLNPQQIARQANGTILFYWLGEKQSYLWAITPLKTSLFTLPPGAEIDAAVLRYRKALGGLQDVLEADDPDGQALYRMLVEPAQAILRTRPLGAKALPSCRSCGTAKGVPFPESAAAKSVSAEPGTLAASAKVFVIPDGSLNNLNFETLLVSEPDLPTPVSSKPKLHYWIEDVTIANASSLRVLDAARTGKRNNRSNDRVNNKERRDRSLLLFGNSVAPNATYPELPKAAAQMESVARHFPTTGQRVFTREQATPAAYLASNPEKFSYLHFVAHGTASRLSPLDSAIVLSKTAPSNGGLSNDLAEDSFKLYARDIIRHPLRADLVTISACHGADGRAYSGEGLVGLSWAFIRAGAHNVVAALWEVTDVSTPQLMDKFYDELDKGASPDAALRAAKLQLLRNTGFRNPYYWAPFQLYAGS